MSDKQLVLETLERLPETATLDEIREEVAILAAIRRGERALERGEILSHEELKRKSAEWTTK